MFELLEWGKGKEDLRLKYHPYSIAFQQAILDMSVFRLYRTFPTIFFAIFMFL